MTTNRIAPASPDMLEQAHLAAGLLPLEVRYTRQELAPRKVWMHPTEVSTCPVCNDDLVVHDWITLNTDPETRQVDIVDCDRKEA